MSSFVLLAGSHELACGRLCPCQGMCFPFCLRAYSLTLSLSLSLIQISPLFFLTPQEYFPGLLLFLLSFLTSSFLVIFHSLSQSLSLSLCCSSCGFLFTKLDDARELRTVVSLFPDFHSSHCASRSTKPDTCVIHT